MIMTVQEGITEQSGVRQHGEVAWRGVLESNHGEEGTCTEEQPDVQCQKSNRKKKMSKQGGWPVIESQPVCNEEIIHMGAVWQSKWKTGYLQGNNQISRYIKSKISWFFTVREVKRHLWKERKLEWTMGYQIRIWVIRLGLEVLVNSGLQDRDIWK